MNKEREPWEEELHARTCAFVDQVTKGNLTLEERDMMVDKIYKDMRRVMKLFRHDSN